MDNRGWRIAECGGDPKGKNEEDESGDDLSVNEFGSARDFNDRGIVPSARKVFLWQHCFHVISNTRSPRPPIYHYMITRVGKKNSE
jgi:hypothetical protein